MFFTDLKRGGNGVLIATAVATFLYVIGFLKASVPLLFFYLFPQVVAVLKKEVTKTHNDSEHEDIGGYRQVTADHYYTCFNLKK